MTPSLPLCLPCFNRCSSISFSLVWMIFSCSISNWRTSFSTETLLRCSSWCWQTMPLAFSMNSGGVLAWKLFLNELLFFEFLEMIIIRVYLSSTPMNLFKRSMSFSQSGSFSEFISSFFCEFLIWSFIFGLTFPCF